jgi:hypothetical protein
VTEPSISGADIRTPAAGYPGSTVAAAVLGTFFFPVISLIVALLLIGNENNEVKRASLRTWAFASAGFLLLQLIAGIALFASVSGGTSVDQSGPCVGGPDPGASAPERPDGTAVFPCVGGGSVTVDFSEP